MNPRSSPSRSPLIAAAMLLLLLSPVASQAADVTLDLNQLQSAAPLPATEVTSARVLDVTAREAAATVGGNPTTQAKILVYPLLHDSPDTSIPAAFGTLLPGSYRVSLRFRLVEPASKIRVSLVPKPGSGDGIDFADIKLKDLRASRWYEITGDVTVTGPDAWDGRLAVASSVSTGTIGNPLRVWYDNIKLVQDPDLAGDGCDPNCLRAPLDFEQDPIGERPDRMLSLTIDGSEDAVEVGDHLPWQTLPAWYEANRLHLGTRLRARSCLCEELSDPSACQPLTSNSNTYDISSPTFLDATDFVQELGARVLTRHVKSGPEGPWWPTAVPTTAAAYRPECVNDPVDLDGSPFVDIASEIIDRAHQPVTPGGIDTRLIAYYWMMSDFGVRNQPPDMSGTDGWSARDYDTSLSENARGFYISQNSPYPDLVAARLVELAERDADGIKFDSMHNPPDGDWSDWSESDFIAAGYGLELPPQDPNIAGYWRLLDLYDDTIRASFDLYHRAVHRARAETALLVSVGNLQALWEPSFRSTFAEQQQVAKGEWHKGWRRLRLLFEDELGIAETDHPFHLPARDLQSGFGFSLMRDATNGRPPHVWARAPAEVPDTNLSAPHIDITTSGLLTYGNAANLDINEPRIKRVLESPNGVGQADTGGPYLRAVDFATTAGGALAGLRPHRWIGIHFNEHARQEIYEDLTITDIEDRYEAAWNSVLAPAVWAFAALSERGIPAGIVTDQHLARGELYGYAPGDDNAYDVLFLPSLDLTPEAQTEIEAFKTAGGRVVCSQVGPASLCSDSGLNGQPWIWHTVAAPDTSARDDAILGFFDAISPNQGVLLDGRVLDAPVGVYYVRDTATGTLEVAPHIAAYADPGGSGRLVVALSNRWSDILDNRDTFTTTQERIEFEPPEIGGPAGRIYLRGGLVSGTETFCYATLADPTWKTIDAQHLVISLTAPAGVRALIKLDDGDADPDDDLNFQYGLMIEVRPDSSCSS